MNEDRALEQWLRRFGWALGRLSPAERDDIVRETQTHIEERIAAGRPSMVVLADFGPPERFARQFVDEMEACEAIGSQRSGDLVRVVTGRAHRNVVAAATLFALLVLGVMSVVAVIMVALKIYDPLHTGLWVGPHTRLVGVIDDPRQARELLGLWLFPLAALVLLVAWVIGRVLLSLAVPLLLLARPIHSPSAGRNA